MPPSDSPPSSDTIRLWRHVLLAGATGLVGREINRLLGEDPAVAEVVALVRRPLDASWRHARLVERIVNFDAIGSPTEAEDVDFAADQVFCAMGTTIKRAGSQEAFRRVDFEYPLRIAERARAAGATHFLLVSALGADARSRVFYNRVKGELEEAVRALGFPSLTIARPSLLEGDREEFRPVEVISSKLGFLVPPQWKPVHVRQVARALVHAASVGRLGEQILENAELRTYTR